MTLAAGFLALILAPEFFQPLRDLGTFYHAKAQAVGAADSLKTFMETPLAHPQRGEAELASTDPVTIEAEDLFITSPEGKTLAGPLNFTLPAGQRAVLVGRSGSGKSSLLNALSGFLSYQGSLRINGIELRDLSPESWRKHLSWVGQTHNYRQQHYGITYYWRDLMPANKSYKQRWITPGSVSFYRSCHKALIRLLATRLPAFPWGRRSAWRWPVRY